MWAQLRQNCPANLVGSWAIIKGFYLKPLSFVSLLYSNAATAAAKLLQSCPTLCGPIDCIPPGSAVPGILQARTLEWVAISFSNAWKWKVKVKSLSRVRLFMTPWTAAYQAPPSMGFPRQDHWSGLPLPSPLIPLNKHQLAEKLLCGPWQNIHKLIYLMVMGGVHYGGQNYWSERQQHSQFPHLPKSHAESVFLETKISEIRKIWAEGISTHKI